MADMLVFKITDFVIDLYPKSSACGDRNKGSQDNRKKVVILHPKKTRFA